MLAKASLQTLVLTDRMEIAEAFYREILGLRLVERSHGAAVFDVGGGELRLSPVPKTKPSEHTILGFAVPDLVAVVSALIGQGVVLERFPGWPHDARGVIRTPEGASVAWFRDPDGNLLSVVEYPKSPPH